MTSEKPTAGEVVVQAAGVGKEVPVADGTLSILAGVDLAITAGSTASISGPSGSGKTTLLGLLAGLDRPSTGTVSLLGHDLSGLDEDGRAHLRRGRVGFVFQSFHLLPNLTARENIALALEVVPGADRIAARSAEALDRVGLADRAGHLPAQLSGGEQQRVALARAIVVTPALLFADEPTGNLDHATRGQVADLMFALCRDHGTTLVLVTHDASLAGRCTHCYRLDAGRLSRDAGGA